MTPGYPSELYGVVDLGARHFAIAFDEKADAYLWWHDCTVEPPSWGWFGMMWSGPSGHSIQQKNPLTVGGSLLCNLCGDHGFIRDGAWVTA